MTLKYVTAIVAQVPISQQRCWDKTLCVACQPFSDWAVQRRERVLGKEPRKPVWDTRERWGQQPFTNRMQVFLILTRNVARSVYLSLEWK